MAKQGYDLNAVRDFLLYGIGDEGLLLLCHEVPAFRPLYADLAQGADKAEVVETLVGHAARTGQVPALLALLKELHPPPSRRSDWRQTSHRPKRVKRTDPARRLRPIRVKVGSAPPVKRVISGAQQQPRAARHAPSTGVLPPKKVVTRLQITLGTDDGDPAEAWAHAIEDGLAWLPGTPEMITIAQAQPGEVTIVVELPVADALLFLFHYRQEPAPEAPTKRRRDPQDWMAQAMFTSLRALEPEEARAIEEARQHADRLVALAPQLPDEQREEALAEALVTTLNIRHPWARARALGDLARQTTGVTRQEALQALRAIGSGITPADLLAAYPTPRLTGELRARVRDVRLVEDGTALHGINLSGLDLRRADLHGADLRGNNMNRTCLREASLVKARLARASLVEADLHGADLRRADLRDAAVTARQLAQARSLEGATLPDGSVHE